VQLAETAGDGRKLSERVVPTAPRPHLRSTAPRRPGVRTGMAERYRERRSVIVNPTGARRRSEIIGAPDDSAEIPFLKSHGIRLFRGRGRMEGAALLGRLSARLVA